MKILVGGMGASGSTLLFNILIELYTQAGFKVSSGWYSKMNINDPAPIVIVKTHEYTKEWHKAADIIFNTRRDIRDCIASRIRKSNDKSVSEIAKQYLQFFNDWHDHCNYEFVYGEYKNNPVKVIAEIIQTIGLDDYNIDIKKLIEIVNALPTQSNTPQKDSWNNAYFKQRLISKRHVTNGGQIGGYTKTLSLEQIRVVESICGDWLRKFGYLKH